MGSRGKAEAGDGLQAELCAARERIAELEKILKHRELRIEEQRRNKEHLRTILEDQIDFVSRYTPDGVTTYINNAYIRKQGLSREEVVARELDRRLEARHGARDTRETRLVEPA